MSETTKQAMRETVKAAAEAAHARPVQLARHGGRGRALGCWHSPHETDEIDRPVREADAAAARREREFYEETYARYEGSHEDLPWHREAAATARKRAEAKAEAGK